MSAPSAAGATLEELLEQLCREETLDGDNLWHCPACGQRVVASKKLDLWKLPPLLIVSLLVALGNVQAFLFIASII